MDGYYTRRDILNRIKWGGKCLREACDDIDADDDEEKVNLAILSMALSLGKKRVWIVTDD